MNMISFIKAMKGATYLLGIALFLTVFFTQHSFGQAGSAAVPFLLNSPSAELNGMGEATVGLETDNAFALFWNPAQLGLLSLHQYGSVGFSSNSMTDLSDGKELTNNTSVYQAGVNLGRMFKLPIGLSFGMAYSRNTNNMGTFIETTNDPTPIATFDAKETSDQYSFGIGFDAGWFYGSVGKTHKSINSSLAPFDVQGQGIEGIAEASAIDEGAFLGVKAIDAFSHFSSVDLKFLTSYTPFLNFGFGYSRNNVGTAVKYIDAAQADPLPRTVREGFSISLGVTYSSEHMNWNPVGFRWVNEASDLLVRRWGEVRDTNYQVIQEAGWKYESGTGNIHLGNVLFGTGNSNIEKRKGWELGIVEFFFLRGGSIEDPQGNRYVTTDGYGFRLQGALKFIKFLSHEEVSSPVLSWILDHVDFMYNRSTNTSDAMYEPERTYDDFIISIRQ